MKRPCSIVILFLAYALSAGGNTQSQIALHTPDDTATFYLVFAESVTGNSANLIADLATGGLPTTCSFEWGTTTAYDHQCPAALLTGPSGLRHRIECSLEQLNRNTLYHFRAVARDSLETSCSADYAFFTAAAHLTTLAAESISTTSALLRATCDPGGVQMKVSFLYGIDSLTYELQTPGVLLSDSSSVADISISVTNLTPNTQYYFEPIAQAATYPTVLVRGRPASFTTLADPYVRGFVIPIEMKNRFGVTTSGPRLFGVHSHASYCKDIGLGEHEIPPYPPTGTPELRFIDYHGFSDCMGLGLYWDLRHYCGPAQVDTYMVHIQPDNSGYPLILSWSDLSAHYAGPVRLLDPYGGTVVNTDMKTQTSDTISVWIDQLLMVAEGPINLVASKVNTITESSVLLDGSFDPGGIRSYGWFEWGDTTDYAHASPASDLGSGNIPVDFVYALTNLQPGARYHFRAAIQNAKGNFYGADQTFTTGSVTSVDQGRHPRTAFLLHQNYPNPFNPVTVIHYEVPVPGHVVLKLYNVLGQEVKTLIDEAQTPGMKSFRFDASDLSDGVYFYELSAGGFRDTKKMILMK